jgi:hypothetical protein
MEMSNNKYPFPFRKGQRVLSCYISDDGTMRSYYNNYHRIVQGWKECQWYAPRNGGVTGHSWHSSCSEAQCRTGGYQFVVGKIRPRGVCMGKRGFPKAGHETQIWITDKEWMAYKRREDAKKQALQASEEKSSVPS